jgi:hypothetical protein
MKSNLVSWPLPLFPGFTLTVGLFLKKDSSTEPVINESFVNDAIIIDATVVPDLLFIQSAACRALSSLQHNGLVTKSLLEELVFYLYPSNSFNLLKDLTAPSSFAYLIHLSKEPPLLPLDHAKFLPLEEVVLDKARIAKIFNLKDAEYSAEKHLTQCLNALVTKKV